MTTPTAQAMRSAAEYSREVAGALERHRQEAAELVVATRLLEQHLQYVARLMEAAAEDAPAC